MERQSCPTLASIIPEPEIAFLRRTSPAEGLGPILLCPHEWDRPNWRVKKSPAEAGEVMDWMNIFITHHQPNRPEQAG